MRLRPPAIAVFLAIAATACARGPVNTDAQLYAMVDTIGLAELRRSPERAAVLGVAVQTFGEDYRSRLDDRSMAAVERMRATRLDFLRQLEAVDRATLSRDASRTLEIAQRVVSSTVKMDAYSFGYADLGRASPYLISQMDGAYAGVIDFMTVDQTIGSRADADAWLARLEHVDDAVTDEYRRFEIDRERGVLPPAGILQQALEKARALQSADPLAHPLTQFFAESLSQLNDLPEGEIASLIGKAAGIVEDDIGPVYDRLVTLLETSAASAAPEPGVWRIPNGEAYYEDALRLYTTSDLTPRQIRDVGVALVEELTGEINTALIALGRTEGTVGQRLEAMRLEPLFLYPDTLEGRAALLAAVSERASWGEQKAPAMLSVAAAAQVEIKLAPASLETAGPDIHYRPAALDGSRQAALILNLRSTLDWPNWTLPTLAYREAAPGRHLQLGIARARARPRPCWITSPPTRRSAKAGRLTPRIWRRNWGRMRRIRPDVWAISSRCSFAPLTWWRTPASTTTAGRATGRWPTS